MSLRSVLYALARWLGDFNAVRRGRVGRRIYNRGIGRLFGRLFK